MIFYADAVKVRFNDIGSLERQKTTLHDLISLPLKRPDIFGKGVLKNTVSGVLLFGPPGTGKTMLAKAVAAESGANFLAVSTADIMDKYVGEAEKNAKVMLPLSVPSVLIFLLLQRPSLRLPEKSPLVLFSWMRLTRFFRAASRTRTQLAAKS